MRFGRIIVTENSYFSQLDEDTFFAWLEKIPFLVGYKGYGNELHIIVGLEDSRTARELWALFCRYEVDMKKIKIYKVDAGLTLKDFETEEKQPKKYAMTFEKWVEDTINKSK